VECARVTNGVNHRACGRDVIAYCFFRPRELVMMPIDDFLTGGHKSELERAEARVRRSEELVENQRELVSSIAAFGGRTAVAVSVLGTLESVLAQQRRHLERLQNARAMNLHPPNDDDNAMARDPTQDRK
jgi:hypothetical protein